MKVTGWAVLLIGVLIGVYCLFSISPSPDAPTSPPTDAAETRPFPVVYILGPFAGIAVVAGILMLVYGGSGVIRTRNLAVRN